MPKSYLGIDEQLALFNSNTRLATYIAETWRNPYFRDNFPDIVQEAHIGLWKACKSFNPDKGAKFSTYAGRCINNQIGMFFRGMKRRHIREVGLQSVLAEDDEGNEVTYEDFLALDDTADTNLIVQEAFRNATSKSEQLFLLYALGSETQKDIAKRFGYSQSYVSRLCIRGQHRLRKKLEV